MIIERILLLNVKYLLTLSGQNANRIPHNVMLCCLVKHHYLKINHRKEEREVDSVVRFFFCHSSPALTRNKVNLLDCHLLSRLAIYCLSFISGKNPKNELRVVLSSTYLHLIKIHI